MERIFNMAGPNRVELTMVICSEMGINDILNRCFFYTVSFLPYILVKTSKVALYFILHIYTGNIKYSICIDSTEKPLLILWDISLLHKMLERKAKIWQKRIVSNYLIILQKECSSIILIIIKFVSTFGTLTQDKTLPYPKTTLE